MHLLTSIAGSYFCALPDQIEIDDSLAITVGRLVLMLRLAFILGMTDVLSVKVFDLCFERARNVLCRAH